MMRKMIMKKTMLFTALLMAFTACSKAPALKVYTIDIPKTNVTKSSQYHTQTIKVTYPQSLREQMSQKMNFSYSTNDRGTYQNSEWSNDMSKILQGTIIDVLDRTKQFKVVLSNTSTLKENYRLESNIFEFEHKVRGKLSLSVVTMQYTLIDADTGKLVKSKRFSYQEVTPTIDAKGYASATNVIMRRLSSDLVRWLR